MPLPQPNKKRKEISFFCIPALTLLKPGYRSKQILNEFEFGCVELEERRKGNHALRGIY